MIPSPNTVSPLYAAPQQYADWIGSDEPQDDKIGLLRSATFAIAEAADRNPYSDTPTPADAAVLADATCAQVQAWSDSGVTPTDQVGSGTLKERAFDTARFVYDTTGQPEARAAAVAKIGDEARRILYVGGLLSLPLPVGAAPNDTLPTYGLPTTWAGVGFDPFGWEAARDAGYGYGFLG